MPYYKVVSQDLKSITDHPIGVEYGVGKRTKSLYPYAPLFVFDDLHAAIEFNRYNVGHGRIFECEIEKSNRPWGAFLSDDLEEFLKKKKQKKGCADLLKRNRHVLNHTVFADSVMLSREVEDFPDRIYYKVVDERLASAMITSMFAGINVQYRTYEWINPKDKRAPLMVFSTLGHAQRFIRSNLSTLHIYECKIKKSTQKWGMFTPASICKILNNSANVEDVHDNGLPPGTVLADSVYLMKRIFLP